MFYYLLIVNKNGSLIYDRAFSNSLKLTSNEVINIASIFYSMHAISSKLTPPGYEQTSELKLENGGIEIMEASAMRLVCFQTLTKIKFIFVTDYQTNLDKCTIIKLILINALKTSEKFMMFIVMSLQKILIMN